MKKRILKLIKEPSTFAGLASMLGGISVAGLTEDMWLQIFGAVAAVAGVVAMFVLDTYDAEALDKEQ
jgi:hypothetical protein